jgi:hypothetical protein
MLCPRIMATRKHNDSLKFNIIGTDPGEVLMAKYLRASGKMKPQLTEAFIAYWHPIALANEEDSTDEDVEIALSKSLGMLAAQMTRLIEYQRVKRKIQLPIETLQRLGVASIPQAPVKFSFDSPASVNEPLRDRIPAPVPIPVFIDPPPPSIALETGEVNELPEPIDDDDEELSLEAPMISGIKFDPALFAKLNSRGNS